MLPDTLPACDGVQTVYIDLSVHGNLTTGGRQVIVRFNGDPIKTYNKPKAVAAPVGGGGGGGGGGGISPATSSSASGGTTSGSGWPSSSSSGGTTSSDSAGGDVFTKFYNELDRPYEDSKKEVKQVEFMTGGHVVAATLLKFPAPVTEAAAIAAVERYLREPITRDYYNMVRGFPKINGKYVIVTTAVKDDGTFECEWEDDGAQDKVRGDLLGEHKHLQSVKIEDGTMTFFLGS